MAARSNGYQGWGVPERIAAWAAGAGFGFSALAMLLYQAASNGAWGGIELRAAMETLFVFLWPSAILLTGAQTAEGGAILFLFSATLNAGYFVFVSLGAYLLYGKLEASFATASHSNVAPLRVYSAPRIVRRVGASNPLA